MKKWGTWSKLGLILAIAAMFLASMAVSFLLWVWFIKLCVKF